MDWTGVIRIIVSTVAVCGLVVWFLIESNNNVK